MKYLGIVKKENGTLVVPDAFNDVAEPRTYEAVQVGGDILLLFTPLDRERLKKIDELTESSIRDHRKTLEGLAR
jgi:hypothetical protein